jgi:hypothetical protein
MLPMIAGLLCAGVMVLNGDGCPIWPCEVWVGFLVGLVSGGVVGFFMGRRTGGRPKTM